MILVLGSIVKLPDTNIVILVLGSLTILKSNWSHFFFHFFYIMKKKTFFAQQIEIANINHWKAQKISHIVVYLVTLYWFVWGLRQILLDHIHFNSKLSFLQNGPVLFSLHPYLIFPFHLLPSPFSPTGFYIFSGFLAIFSLLSSVNNND